MGAFGVYFRDDAQNGKEYGVIHTGTCEPGTKLGAVCPPICYLVVPEGWKLAVGR